MLCGLLWSLSYIVSWRLLVPGLSLLSLLSSQSSSLSLLLVLDQSISLWLHRPLLCVMSSRLIASLD